MSVSNVVAMPPRAGRASSKIVLPGLARDEGRRTHERGVNGFDLATVTSPEGVRGIVTGIGLLPARHPSAAPARAGGASDGRSVTALAPPTFPTASPESRQFPRRQRSVIS